jgi:acetylornithine/N-succinyldiaminopimelate aminotransferase
VPFGDLAAVKAAIGDDTAGILIEPIQGEGGIHVADHGFLRALRGLCDEHGLLLVLDEIQCGMGRTGRLFAHEWAGITPDIMGIAKAIGAGFPLGACLATEDAACGMTAGTHGSTFGGNPLATAVGNAVLDVMLEDGFLERVRDLGVRLSQKLAMIADEHPSIVESVRGEGLMLGLKARVPVKDLIDALIGQKLLAIGAGDNVARIMPPLIVTDSEIDEGIGRIEAACRALEAAGGAS